MEGKKIGGCWSRPSASSHMLPAALVAVIVQQINRGSVAHDALLVRLVAARSAPAVVLLVHVLGLVGRHAVVDEGHRRLHVLGLLGVVELVEQALGPARAEQVVRSGRVLVQTAHASLEQLQVSPGRKRDRNNLSQ